MNVQEKEAPLPITPHKQFKRISPKVAQSTGDILVRSLLSGILPTAIRNSLRSIWLPLPTKHPCQITEGLEYMKAGNGWMGEEIQ